MYVILVLAGWIIKGVKIATADTTSVFEWQNFVFPLHLKVIMKVEFGSLLFYCFFFVGNFASNEELHK